MSPSELPTLTLQGETAVVSAIKSGDDLIITCATRGVSGEYIPDGAHSTKSRIEDVIGQHAKSWLWDRERSEMAEAIYQWLQSRKLIKEV